MPSDIDGDSTIWEISMRKLKRYTEHKVEIRKARSKEIPKMHYSRTKASSLGITSITNSGDITRMMKPFEPV